MIEWIQNNASSINAATSVAMLAVWMVYLHVFQRGYRRQTRAKIVINRAVGKTLDAHCFISNMSAHSIYVETVLVTVECKDCRISGVITDFSASDEERPTDPRQETHQGPLHSGDQTSLGTFDHLIQRTVDNQDEPVRDLIASSQSIGIEVMVIGDYLSDDLVVGAKRRFVAEKNGETWLVRPKTVQTEQVRSRRERRSIRRLLAEDAGATS